MLIPDYPLMVLPKLAIAVGLEEAIVIQQIYWLLNNPTNGREVDGKRWIFNTIEQWQKSYFPFWSIATMTRIFNQLETMMVVESCQPDGAASRRKYYRLNEGMIELLRKGKILKPKKKSKWDAIREERARLAELEGFDQVDKMENVKVSKSYSTKTTPTDYWSKESKASPHSVEVVDFSDSDKKEVFPVESKPDNRSPEEKLSTIRVPRDYPDEEEFDEFLQDEECAQIIDKRSELYQQLCNQKWHEWIESAKKWRRIRDWRTYVLGLERTMAGAAAKRLARSKHNHGF